MNFSHLQYQLCNYSLSELVQAVQQQRLHLNAASVTRPWSAKQQQKLLNFIKQQLILPPFYLATAANITPQLIDGTQRLLVLQTATAPLLHNYHPPVRVYQLYQAHFTKRELQQLNRWYNRK